MGNEVYQIPVKNRDILNIFKALNALDGRAEPVEIRDKEGNLSTQLVVKPYSFGGKTRLSLAKWLTSMKQANDELSKVHDGLVAQFADPANPLQVSEAKMPEFSVEWDKALDEPHMFSLPPVPIAELKSEENLLPVSILAVLEPILV